MNGNFTKVDNWLFDTVMPKAKPNTFKVVAAVVRKTVGWQKSTDVISLSAFHELTGISSRRTLCAAIDDAIEHGYIARTEHGGSYEYMVLGSTETVPHQYRNGTTTSTETVPVGSTETVHTKEIEKKDKESVSTLAQHFQSKTGLFYSPALWDSEWEPLLDHWLNQYGDKTRGMIDAALDVAWGKNESGRRYTLKSPMSLQAIMANLDPAKLNGTISIGAR